MKRKVLALAIVGMFLTSVSLFALPWGHRYDNATDGQVWQSTTVNENTSLRMSVEWGEGDWDGAMGSAIGYGLANDGIGWTWAELPWFEDDGGNKRCRTDVIWGTIGTNWYAYRFIKGASGPPSNSYQHGSSGWSENASSLGTAVSYVNVVPEPMLILGAGLLAGLLLLRK